MAKEFVKCRSRSDMEARLKAVIRNLPRGNVFYAPLLKSAGRELTVKGAADIFSIAFVKYIDRTGADPAPLLRKLKDYVKAFIVDDDYEVVYRRIHAKIT